MGDDDKKQLAQELKEQSDREFQILAHAQKSGYLPEVKLSGIDEWLIEERQSTLEERIQQRTEERNQQYLKDHALWGERYANPNKETFTFGNWSNSTCENYNLRAACDDKSLPIEEQLANKKKLAEKTEDMAYLNTSRIQERPEWQLNSADIVSTTSAKDSSYAPLAFNFSKQTLFINENILATQVDNGYKPLSEAAKGNPVAMNCIVYHELNHKQNWDSDGLGQLSYTPTNAAKGAVLTEKISYSVEYLELVKEYGERKANGDTTIKYKDGSEKPLDSLLEMYPGIKETVEKYGTDISNPETKKAIVSTAMHDWEQNRGKEYAEQTLQEAQWGNTYFNQCSFSKQTELLKNEEETYKKASTAMLSDVNIGGQKIDLKDCKDLLDTYTTENAHQMIEAHNKDDITHQSPISLPTYQEYQEINQYLESIGKKTDAEKMEHIAQTVKTASSSINSYDRTLENIMLAHNPQITSEALDIERTDKSVVATYFGDKYDITEYATPATERPDKAQDKSSLALIKDNDFKEMPTITLAMLDQSNR